MRSSLEDLWLRSGFHLRIARVSLNNNRDQWSDPEGLTLKGPGDEVGSDLSIILQFLNISSVKIRAVNLKILKEGDFAF